MSGRSPLSHPPYRKIPPQSCTHTYGRKTKCSRLRYNIYVTRRRFVIIIIGITYVAVKFIYRVMAAGPEREMYGYVRVCVLLLSLFLRRPSAIDGLWWQRVDRIIFDWMYVCVCVCVSTSKSLSYRKYAVDNRVQSPYFFYIHARARARTLYRYACVSLGPDLLCGPLSGRLLATTIITFFSSTLVPVVRV